jgi:hypothetical protein
MSATPHHRGNTLAVIVRLPKTGMLKVATSKLQPSTVKQAQSLIVVKLTPAARAPTTSTKLTKLIKDTIAPGSP